MKKKSNMEVVCNKAYNTQRCGIKVTMNSGNAFYLYSGGTLLKPW